MPSPPPTDWVPQRRHTKFRLAAFRAVEGVARALGGRRFYRRRFLSARRIAVREERVAVRDLPPALEGFTIAQWGDLHAGPFLREEDLGGAVEVTRGLRPDLFVLTGDYITHTTDEGLGLERAFARVEPRLGSFAVFGNHDYRGRREDELTRAYASAGVRVLRDECARVPVGDATLAIVGIEDLEEAKQVDIDRARRDVRPGDVEVVLCHNPAGARRFAREGCVAVLSGHTHALQVDLPLLRRMGPKHPGLRVQLGDTRLVVTRGLGVVGLPLRYRAPAEVVVLRLERDAVSSRT